LGNFKGMRQAIAKMIGITSGEDLCFGFKSAKGTRMYDAIAIACIFSAIWVRLFGVTAAS